MANYEQAKSSSVHFSHVAVDLCRKTPAQSYFFEITFYVRVGKCFKFIAPKILF